MKPSLVISLFYVYTSIGSDISALGLKNYSTSFTDVVRECQATNTLCHDVTTFVT